MRMKVGWENRQWVWWSSTEKKHLFRPFLKYCLFLFFLMFSIFFFVCVICQDYFNDPNITGKAQSWYCQEQLEFFQSYQWLKVVVIWPKMTDLAPLWLISWSWMLCLLYSGIWRSSDLQELMSCSQYELPTLSPWSPGFVSWLHQLLTASCF